MDPISIFINLLIGIVTSLSSTLLQQAFSQKPKTGTRSTVSIGGKVPQYFLLGTVAESGKREYRNTWGHSGNVPNAYFVDVLSFGDLPISAMVGAFVNGTRITLASSGAVTQGIPVSEFNNKLWWTLRDGTQTTADSYLVSKFGSDADRPWTGDMIGRGIPTVSLTALWDQKLWTKLPEFVGEFQGIALYDPRKDSTAGGDGTQRWADQSTWAFSDNNMVMIYNIERGIQYAGARVWGGSASAAQLPYEAWSAAMDACDVAVPLAAGGTEKRFRAGRKVSLNERPSDVVQELLVGCNGRIVHTADGMVYPLVGVPSEADGGFADLDVLATEPLGSIPFPNLDGIINGATATYREPAQAWEDKETAPYLRSDLETEDDGRQQLKGLSLDTTFSGTQAQRILKAVIEEGRRFRTHVVALPPEFAQFRPLHVLAWTSTRFGYDGKLFLITARTRAPWGSVVFALQEVDPSDHDWTTDDEQPLAFAPAPTNRPAPQPMTGWGAAPAFIPDNDGLPRRPTIAVSFAAGLVDVRAVRVQVRLAGEMSPVFDGELPYDPVDTEPAALLYAPLVSSTAYEVRGKLLPYSGRETLWSNQDTDGMDGPWFSVTTPYVPEIGPGMVDWTVLSSEVQGIVNWIGATSRELVEAARQSSLLAAEQDLENYDQVERIKRTINVQFGNLQASFDEFIEAAIGPGGAITLLLTTIFAALGGNSSQVMVRWEAIAAPEGVEARWALQLRVSGDVFGSAGIYLDLKPDGTSTLILDATKTLITTDGGLTFEAMFNEDGAFIRDITAGTIRSGDGNSFWNLTTGAFRIAAS